MPRISIDYNKTVIYKIVSNDLNITQCYVGHTTDFTRRKSSHKNRCNNEKNKKHHFKVYQIIRENGGFFNWEMIEIEKYPCKDVYEAKKKEREWFEKLNSTLNTNYPERSRKEWLEDNRDEIAKKKKMYYENNRIEIIEKVNKYWEKNKESINEKKRIFYEKNKEEINEKQKQMMVCECGREITRCKISRHLKSKLHNKLLKTINDNLLGKEII
jgi:hypothetical protein